MTSRPGTPTDDLSRSTLLSYSMIDVTTADGEKPAPKTLATSPLPTSSTLSSAFSSSSLSTSSVGAHKPSLTIATEQKSRSHSPTSSNDQNIIDVTKNGAKTPSLFHQFLSLINLPCHIVRLYQLIKTGEFTYSLGNLCNILFKRSIPQTKLIDLVNQHLEHWKAQLLSSKPSSMELTLTCGEGVYKIEISKLTDKNRDEALLNLANIQRRVEWHIGKKPVTDTSLTGSCSLVYADKTLQYDISDKTITPYALTASSPSTLSSSIQPKAAACQYIPNAAGEKTIEELYSKA